jgi:hypothetical protein
LRKKLFLWRILQHGNDDRYSLVTKGPSRRRFHVSVGPDSLFERCLEVVRTRLEPIEFGRRINPFLERAAERLPPNELLAPFVSADWELVTVDALVSSGKWFSAGWRRKLGDGTWFLVFGRSGDSSELITVFPTEPIDIPLKDFNNGPEIVHPDDPFYAKVDRVDCELLQQK